MIRLFLSHSGRHAAGGVLSLFLATGWVIAAPTIQSVSVSPDPVTGPTATLSVNATGTGTMEYIWSISAPSGVEAPVLQTPLAQTTSVTLPQIGGYTARVSVGDSSGERATATLQFSVAPIQSGFRIFDGAAPAPPQNLPPPAAPALPPDAPPVLPPAYSALEQLRITPTNVADNFAYLRLDRCEELIGLKYAAPWRYDGATIDGRRDYRKTLNLYIPTGSGPGPFPVVFHVHGGSYTGGNKDGNYTPHKKLFQELLDNGIAVVSFAYILNPQGIFPQVWWDFQDAARYLRKNATLLKLDPRRFGAVGLSAGGWLISTATMANEEHWRVSVGASTTASALAASGFKVSVDVAERQKERAWLRQHAPTAPAHPGIYGGFQALSFDFSYRTELATAASPAMQRWVGAGYVPSEYTTAVAAGAEYILTEMMAPNQANQQVHVPPFYNHAEAVARTLDGNSTTDLGHVIVDFFKWKLIQDPKSPAPEIHPAGRFFTGNETVSILSPAGTTVRYTTDGSEPNASSPVYTQPFTITANTTVKAYSTASGFRDGGVVTARFIAGWRPPRVTAPNVAALPPGVTGQPYSVTFTSDRTGSVRWLMQADLTPYDNGTSFRFPNGMSIDAVTGEWSGTPATPGTYHIQVWVNDGAGFVAGYRDYTWTVTGDVLSENPWGAPPAATDTNVELALITPWTTVERDGVLVQMVAAGFKPVIGGDLLLVPAEEKSAARTWMEANLSAALLSGLTWR